MDVGPGHLASVVALLLLACAVVLVCVYRLRRARIEKFAREATRGSASERDAVFALARALYLSVRRGPNPMFLTRLLAPLGPSPTAVLDRGGWCSGIHRLFITCLDAIGIHSAQITVYRPGPVAMHCLAQVTADRTPIIIDVDYGIWYRHPDGGPVNLAQLRAGVVPVHEVFIVPEARRIEGKFNTPPGYPDNSHFVFDYRLTRTANWTGGALRRFAYALLNPLSGGRLDCMLLPAQLEWPELVLALIFAGAALLILAARGFMP